MGVFGSNIDISTPTPVSTPSTGQALTLPLKKGREGNKLDSLGIFKESFERKYEFAGWRNGNFVIEYRFRAITFDFT